MNGGEFFKFNFGLWHNFTTLSINFHVFSIVRRLISNLGGVTLAENAPWRRENRYEIFRDPAIALIARGLDWVNANCYERSESRKGFSTSLEIVFVVKDVLLIVLLHPPNVTYVLRYFGPTLTWFFCSFKLLLVRCTVCLIHKSDAQFICRSECTILLLWSYSEKKLVFSYNFVILINVVW